MISYGYLVKTTSKILLIYHIEYVKMAGIIN